MSNWLDEKREDDSWLDEKPARKPAKKPKKSPRKKASVRVESSAKLRNEKARFASMTKALVGRSRVWACDGEYVAFRRKLANPATLERHNRFIQSGDYKFIGNHDGVELFELQAGSPFKRPTMNLLEMPPDRIRRIAVVAACGRDWGTYVDAISELASRVKGSIYSDGKPAQGAFAEDVWKQHIERVFALIALRGGPSHDEMNRGVAAVRMSRGEMRNRVILTPRPVVA